MVIFGTRPEAIKLASVIRLLKDAYHVDLSVVSSGQHRELMDHVLDTFEVFPDIELNLIKHNYELDRFTSELLCRLTRLYDEFRPDIVVVHGDTSTAFTAALAAFYRGISVAHVEAGLRTGLISEPFPEEFNRRAITLMSNLHFAPTEANRANLLSEGVKSESIFITGNTGIDSLRWVSQKLRNDLVFEKKVASRVLRQLTKCVEENKYVLITSHRRENFGDGLKHICLAIKDLSEYFPEITFIYPMHLNPKVKVPVASYLSDIQNVILTEPFEYPEFVWLLCKCMLVMTDSGGLQEEASAIGKQVIVLRETTERQEGVSAGVLVLAGTSRDKIFTETRSLIMSIDKKKLAYDSNIFGDGNSSKRVVKQLLENRDAPCMM